MPSTTTRSDSEVIRKNKYPNISYYTALCVHYGTILHLLTLIYFVGGVAIRNQESLVDLLRNNLLEWSDFFSLPVLYLCSSCYMIRF